VIGNLLAVGIGGMLGALARFGLSSLVARRVGEGFPFATLLVNVVGCLCIGVLFAWFEQRPEISTQTRLLLSTGILGSFTTFSTFGLETIVLAQAGQARLALASVAANLLLGLGAVVLGRTLAQAALASGS